MGLLGGIICHCFLEVFLSLAMGSYYSGSFSLFLIVSQVTVTTTTTTASLVTVVCSKASITMTVMMASTSMGQTTLGQNDVVLPP